MIINNKAKWIGAPAEFDSCKAPYLRYGFLAGKAIERAELLISGLGYYEAWINGRRIGDHVLDPAQTDYEERVFYVVHDVTKLLNKDENAIGVILGNGWYNQDRVWLTGNGENVTKGMSYGSPRLLLELKITFSDGTEKSFFSDENWSCSTGPIIDNNIYAGECYDARQEKLG